MNTILRTTKIVFNKLDIIEKLFWRGMYSIRDSYCSVGN